MELETLSICNVCSSVNLKAIDAKHNLCQCENCKFVFDNPRPCLNEIVSFYSQPTQYTGWVAEIESRDILWHRRLNKLKSHLNPGGLLDIGSGIGQFLNFAKPYFTHVTGTEVSKSAISLAKEMYGLDLIKGSIEEINFGNNKFENITMFHVLEHVNDPSAVIRICYDLLSENGILTIAVPNEVNCWKSKFAFAKRLKYWLRSRDWLNSQAQVNTLEIGRWGLPKICLDGSLSEIHLSHFTPDVLKSLLETCNFQVLENNLDPFYVKNSFINDSSYLFYNLLNNIFGINLYDTIWIVARKVNIAKL
jgi:2-polyprenyl-3-methyl-5-hydroxy-6-metoxy-1,4-benzoquinol methylase